MVHTCDWLHPLPVQVYTHIYLSPYLPVTPKHDI